MSEETEAGRDEGESGAGTGGESPGRLLKAARERKKLSLDELADETLLSTTTLAALEADDFERLSQPVFVRGYYRKCAKILNLPEEELMAAYAAHAGVSGPRPASPGQVDVIPQDVTPHSWRSLGLTLTILAVLAVIAVVWWLTPPPDGEYATGDRALDGAERPIPGIPADDGGAGPAGAAGKAPGTSSARQGSPDGGPAESADEPAPSLQLRFNERSWVEVRDADGERLLQGVVSAGSERTVTGRPPYEVLLGNAPAVEVRLDGERVAFGDRIRGDNTARLELTKDAAE